jgi:hypothetical protein
MCNNLGDSPQALRKTVEYVNQKGIIAPGISPLCIYPGTAVYNFALANNIIKDEEPYCRSIFDSKWETTYFGPLYPNVTDYPIKDWWDEYHKCRHNLETHLMIPLQSVGFNADTDTSRCHNCGEQIHIVRGSVKAHVCKNCVTMNMVNIYLSTLKNEDIFARIRSTMNSAGRIGVMGGVNFTKALLFIATELGINPDGVYIVGNGAELTANIPRRDLKDVAPGDTVLLAGVHCPQKVRSFLVNRGLKHRHVVNVTPPDFKRWLKQSIIKGESFVEFSSHEDIEFFGQVIAENLLEKYGNIAWSILPAGGYGVSMYNGFSKANVQVVAIVDNYKTSKDVSIEIPVVKPNMIEDTGADKAIVCTPVFKVQEELRDDLVKNGMHLEDIILLRDMYDKMWDNLFFV